MTTLKTGINERPAAETPFAPSADIPASNVQEAIEYVWTNGGALISDGDKGDIVITGAGATWTIDAGVVTYAKIQDVSATDRILGRSTAGAGDVEEITCTAAGRALLDDADAAAQRTTLGVGTGDSPQFTAVNIGHATDTTVSRSAAGVLACEGSVMYQRNNILGTVSQTSGAPTGAIIEYGSNANGHYIKYADGTQICWIVGLTGDVADQAIGSFFRSDVVSWTLPSAFASASLQVACGQTDSTLRVMYIGIPDAGVVYFREYAPTSQSVASACRIMAVGRWYS